MLGGMADPTDKWNPIESIGATGTTVATNVKRLRKDRGLAFTDLSARLTDIGRPIPPLGLRKIESGGRRVDADDLVALALALDVSPVTLLMPDSPGGDSEVEVTGLSEPRAAGQVWEWLTSTGPGPLSNGMSRLMFGARAWPQWVHEATEFAYLLRDLKAAGAKFRGDDQ